MATQMTKFLLLTFALMPFFLTGCYYDKEELLYPVSNVCDTTSVSYSLMVEPIVKSNCYTCHSNAVAQTAGAGISLEGHANFSGFVTNNTTKFLNAVKHEPGASPMPKGGNKLPNCDISKIEAWINQGAQNN